jgi:hypothetical protein
VTLSNTPDSGQRYPVSTFQIFLTLGVGALALGGVGLVIHASWGYFVVVTGVVALVFAGSGLATTLFRRDDFYSQTPISMEVRETGLIARLDPRFVGKNSPTVLELPFDRVLGCFDARGMSSGCLSARVDYTDPLPHDQDRAGHRAPLERSRRHSIYLTQENLDLVRESYDSWVDEQNTLP